MKDIETAHRTLKSASSGFATAENRIGHMRGFQYRTTQKHWSWQPRKNKKKLFNCRDAKGHFLKAT